jgi:amino acid transporter
VEATYVPMAFLPITLSIAILRYRLWDIDLVIRRTLVYAVVTALLALVFYGSVILLQRLFTGLTGQQSSAALVASTLVIAALFSPFRRYAQRVVDRRFYRRKYDAERVLAEFAAIARAETNLERLASGLTEAVSETVQPERVAVWLRES